MLARDRMDGWELTKDTGKKCKNTKNGKFCKCDNCPYCKTVQVIKFSGVPTDKDEKAEFAKQAAKLLENYVAAFIDFPKPLIGVLNGPAIGIAASVFGLFDAVYASDR